MGAGGKGEMVGVSGAGGESSAAVGRGGLCACFKPMKVSNGVLLSELSSTYLCCECVGRVRWRGRHQRAITNGHSRKSYPALGCRMNVANATIISVPNHTKKHELWAYIT